MNGLITCSKCWRSVAESGVTLLTDVDGYSMHVCSIHLMDVDEFLDHLSTLYGF